MKNESVYICLISDQRMQNILPLFQKGAGYQHVIMLASGDGFGRINPRFTKIASEMSQALAERAKWELYPEPVDPMNPESTERICKEIVRQAANADRVTINITGGVKPMSIGAYTAGIQSGAHVIYVDTQTETFFEYFADNMRVETFKLEPIGVELLLKIHGRLIREKATPSEEEPDYCQLVENLFSNNHPLIETVQQIQKVIHSVSPTPDGGYETEFKPGQYQPWFIPELANLRIITLAQKKIRASKLLYNFLNGGWLEDYVASSLQKTGIQQMNIGCRLKIKGIENEIDVACALNGKLGIVECKSGSLKGPVGQGILNRLRALKESLGGTFAKSYLVTTCPTSEASYQFKARANEYVSSVIYLDQLEIVGNLIVDQLSSHQR